MKVSHNLNSLVTSFLSAVKELMYIINESKSQQGLDTYAFILGCERTNVHHK